MSTDQNLQEFEWREWALKRLDELVSTVRSLKDQDFDVPMIRVGGGGGD